MNIIRNLSWIFFANAFSSLTKWLMVILIAKNLTAVEVGVYTLAFAIGAPITLFANMKLRSLYITSEGENLKDYLYTRNMLSLIAFMTLILIGYLVYPQYFIIIILVGISKILDLQSDMLYAVPHKNGDLNIIGKLMIIKQLILILVFGAFLFVFKSLTIALLSQIITQLLIIIFLEKIIVYRKYKIVFEKLEFKNIKLLLMLGLPLGFVQMIFSINSNIPRYVLEHYENAKILGYFAAIMYITTIFNLFVSSISQVFLPKLTFIYNSRNIQLFKKYLNFYLLGFSILISILLILTSIFWGEGILILLYGSEYAVYKDILILVSISVGLNLISWNYDTALMAMRYISIQPKITFINLVITIIFAIYLIQKYGIQGAAYTLLISSGMLLIMRSIAVQHNLNSK